VSVLTYHSASEMFSARPKVSYYALKGAQAALNSPTAFAANP
jgi:hypothetical protein